MKKNHPSDPRVTESWTTETKLPSSKQLKDTTKRKQPENGKKYEGHNNGPSAFRPFRVLVLSVRRNSARAMPSQIHFRANFFSLFAPFPFLVPVAILAFFPIKTKNQSTPLISFLGLSFWKKGPREHNIIRSKREQKQPLSRKIPTTMSQARWKLGLDTATKDTICIA